MLKNEPLFLPKGSVRAILVLILTGFICACVWYQIPVSESIIILWAGCVGWYFGGRLNEIKKENGDS